MNKKILKVAFVAAVALASGINVFNAQKEEGLSNTALANVEALAGDEIGKDIYCCGKVGTCAKLLGGGEIKGIPFYTPCP